MLGNRPGRGRRTPVDRSGRFRVCRVRQTEASLRKTVTAYDDRNLRVTEKRDLEVFGDGKL